MIKGNLLTFTDDESSNGQLSSHYTEYYDSHNSLINEAVVRVEDDSILPFQDQVINDLNMSQGSKDKIDHYIMSSGLYKERELKVGTRFKVGVLLISQELEKTTAFIDRAVLSNHLEKIRFYSVDSDSTSLYGSRIVDDFFNEMKLDNTGTNKYLVKVITRLSKDDPAMITYEENSSGVDFSFGANVMYHLSLDNLELSSTPVDEDEQLSDSLLTMKNHLINASERKISELTHISEEDTI